MRVIHIATSDMAVRYLLLDELRHLQDVGHTVSAVCGPGPWVDAVRAAGIPVHTIPLTRRMAPLQDLRALAALIWHLVRERPDLVHTHTPKASLLGQWASLLIRVRHRVHTVHGLYFPGDMRPADRWRYVWLERLQMAPAHLILSVNAEDVETIRTDRIADPAKVRFQGNGVDLERFTPKNASAERRTALREALGIPDGNLVVGIIARLVREKGYLELFQAAQTVLREHPRTTFIAVGGFESAKADRVALDDPAIGALGADLKLLGHRDDVEYLYAVMDVFVLPSHREGLPIAPMEAAATGLPVVATDIRGCRDTVIDGETGFLVPVRDSSALAAAILILVRDGAARERMGAAARRLAEERFDQRQIFARVADAYAELVREQR